MKLHSLFYASILVVCSFDMVKARIPSKNIAAPEPNAKEDVSNIVAEDAEYWARILQQDMSVVVDRCADVTCDNPIEGCDPFDGICKPIDAVVPCIAIIDESDNFSDADIDAMWTNFRQIYPDRPFCLLQPLNTPLSTLYIPPSFLSDPRTTFAQVSRDDLGAASEIQPSPSDWFNICGFSVYQGSDIDFIGKFLDTSGSMTLDTVRASNDLFDQNVSNAGLTNRDVFNSQEDWITPFVTTLVPGA